MPRMDQAQEPARNAQRFWLEYQGRTFELRPGEILIGRSSNCHLVLDDGLVSRRHAQIVITDDPDAERRLLKPSLAHYIARMGAPNLNFHADLFRRLGYDEAVDRIIALTVEGRWADAVDAVPDEMVDEIAIVGDVDRVRAEVARREEAGVSMLLVHCRDVAQVQLLADTLVERPPLVADV